MRIDDKRLQRKGKTYAEIVGTEKAKLWREKQKEAQSGEKNHYFGKSHSEETKKKIGKKSIGRKTMLGKHLSKEAKEKLSISCLKRKEKQGYIVSEKARVKIGKKMKNFWKNKEYLEKMKKRDEKLSIIFAGKGSPAYKDGKSKEPYHLNFNENLKEKIRQRDGKCQICNLSRQKCLKEFKKDLHIHHINRNKKECRPFYLISLCPSHHNQIRTFQNDLKDYFYAKNLSLI